jgi:hypothetical protein
MQANTVAGIAASLITSVLNFVALPAGAGTGPDGPFLCIVEQASSAQRVFAIDTGFKSARVPLLKRADIDAFRWHDLRHHFASRLVQTGTPINTVRELLGHGSVSATLRYPHLATDQKREAVARLVQP